DAARAETSVDLRSSGERSYTPESTLLQAGRCEKKAAPRDGSRVVSAGEIGLNRPGGSLGRDDRSAPNRGAAWRGRRAGAVRSEPDRFPARRRSPDRPLQLAVRTAP